MENSMTVHAMVGGFGQHIYVAWEYDGKRDATRIPNPHWPVINKHWHDTHPLSLPCATPDCEHCTTREAT